MPYLGILCLNLETILSCLKSTPLEFVELQILSKNKKWLNLEPKMPYFGIFRLEFSNNFVIFEINTLKFI